MPSTVVLLAYVVFIRTCEAQRIVLQLHCSLLDLSEPLIVYLGQSLDFLSVPLQLGDPVTLVGRCMSLRRWLVEWMLTFAYVDALRLGFFDGVLAMEVLLRLLQDEVGPGHKLLHLGLAGLHVFGGFDKGQVLLALLRGPRLVLDGKHRRIGLGRPLLVLASIRLVVIGSRLHLERVLRRSKSVVGGRVPAVFLVTLLAQFRLPLVLLLVVFLRSQVLLTVPLLFLFVAGSRIISV